MPPPAEPLNTPSLLARAEALSRWAREDSQRLAVMDSQAAQFASNMFSNLLFGKNAGDMRNSGGFGEQLAGHLAGQLGGAVAGMVGLSPAQMVMATQNMAAYGGMHLAGAGGNIGLTGYGAVTDMASNQLWQQMQSQFSLPGGAPNLARTHGASLDDVGSVMNMMQQRGAFAGTSMGHYETLTSDRLAALKSAASSSGDNGMLKELEQMRPGDTHVSIDPGLASKTTSWASEALKTIQDLRSIVGNLPVEQIAGEIEKLTGVHMGNPQNMGYARQVIGGAVAAGGAAGMSPYESLQFHASTIQSMDASLSAMNGLPTGSFYGLASGAALGIDRASFAAHAEQRAGAAAGRYMERPLTEIAGITANDTARLLMEAPEMTEAAYWASSYANDDPRRQTLLNSIKSYGNAGSVDERTAALRSMAATTESVTGVRSGNMISELGMDALSYQTSRDPGVMSAMNNSLMSTNYAAMTGDFQRMAGDFKYNVSGAFGGTERAGEFTRAMFQQFTPTERTQIQESLSLGGTTSEIQARLAQTMGGMGMPGTYSAQTMAVQLAQHDSNMRMATGGTHGLGDYLESTNRIAASNPALAGLVSANGMAQYNQGLSSQTDAQAFSKGVLPDSFKSDLIQKMLGGATPLEDQAYIAYQRDKDPSKLLELKKNADGGMDLSEEQAEQLHSVMLKGGMDLHSAFGIKGSAKERTAALQEAMRDAGNASLVKGQLASSEGQIVGDFSDATRVALTPEKLREDFNKDIAQQQAAAGIKGGTTLDKAASAGNAARAAAQNVEFNVTIPGLGNILKVFGNALGLR